MAEVKNSVEIERIEVKDKTGKLIGLKQLWYPKGEAVKHGESNLKNTKKFKQEWIDKLKEAGEL